MGRGGPSWNLIRAYKIWEWFLQVALPWSKTLNGPKAIIGDNLSSRLNLRTINICQEEDIKFIFLPPQLHASMQAVSCLLYCTLQKNLEKYPDRLQNRNSR
ncbi:hypothetical protein NQ318_012471 [Aromia moschata]|uniref:Uncharacterized protein n=1 Tax=Aromia moschata TaxID=1265417 RepID=A0AAV8X7T6_9CUCU|nr:hypothetical protein NQ318_012471 [Aromia moschata]